MDPRKSRVAGCGWPAPARRAPRLGAHRCRRVGRERRPDVPRRRRPVAAATAPRISPRRKRSRATRSCCGSGTPGAARRSPAARPNAAHEVLARWSQRGERHDDRHAERGRPAPACRHCAPRAPARLDLGAVVFEGAAQAGSTPWRDERVPMPRLPLCPHCQAPARPAVVWFGEALDEGDLRAALAGHRLRRLPHRWHVVGRVSGRGSRGSGAARGAFTAEINADATPATALVDLAIQGGAGAIQLTRADCHCDRLDRTAASDVSVRLSRIIRDEHLEGDHERHAHRSRRAARSRIIARCPTPNSRCRRSSRARRVGSGTTACLDFHTVRHAPAQPTSTWRSAAARAEPWDVRERTRGDVLQLGRSSLPQLDVRSGQAQPWRRRLRCYRLTAPVLARPAWAHSSATVRYRRTASLPTT